MILPIYANAEKLDPSLLEAASDLGAGPARVFLSVILPLTLPGIAAGVILVFVPAIGMFAVTDLMGGARVPLIGNVIQNQFFQARDWPFGAALGVIFLLLFAGAYSLLNRRAALR
jgi:spermidine/putrescine transport system permease protein